MRWLSTVHTEEGTELIQFVGLLPLLMTAVLVGWQLFLIGNTMVVALHGTREATRALAVCDGQRGDAESALRRASPGYRPLIRNAQRGRYETVVHAAYRIPTIRIARILERQLPDIEVRAIMRTESCPGDNKWLP